MSVSTTQPSSQSSPRRMKVLHVISMLYSGGVERWLTDLCVRARARNMDMEIAVLQQKESLFAQLAREAGIQIHYCPGGGANPLPFIANLRSLIRRNGPYDAVHSHIHLYSAFATLAAYLENVPVRVAHSHNVVSNQTGRLKRRLYLTAARQLVWRFSTHRMAPSSPALEDMVGSGWRRDSRSFVMPCGISLAPFQTAIPDSARRPAFGIDRDAFVIATVGRLSSEKNSDFMVDILGELLRIEPKAYLVMIGEGPLRETLQAKAAKGNFSNRLILAGLRSDVPQVLRGIADIFLFPSPPPPRGNEALPIAVVEAQACGLPVVISDGITSEAIFVKNQVTQRLASESPSAWAQAIVEFARSHKTDPELAGQAFHSSPFSIERNMDLLRTLYENNRG
ncbi:MAG: glycosyltransferase [Bryobacterales bacterium]|nr:glycosyltransferase [Bryobacterales bacterium]